MLRHVSEVFKKTKICWSSRIEIPTFHRKELFISLMIWLSGIKGDEGKGGWNYNLLAWICAFTSDVRTISEVMGIRSFKQNSMPWKVSSVRAWLCDSTKGTTGCGNRRALEGSWRPLATVTERNRRGVRGKMPHGGCRRLVFDLSKSSFWNS